MPNQIYLTLFFTRGVSLETWDDGGMLARELAIYKALQSQGVKVAFATYGGKSEQRFAAMIPGVDIIANRWGWPLDWYQKALEWSPPQGSIFKSNQVDGAEVALKAARRGGAKFIARCGFLLSDFEARRHGDRSPLTMKAKELENRVFSAADRVVGTTEAMAETIVNEYGINRQKIQVIPNYVETARFLPAAKKPASKIRVGYVGRLDKQKNLPTLIEAVQGLGAELLLVGQGPEQPALEAQAAGIHADVHFLGRIANSDLPAFLNSCDLFVLPSFYEGHPKSLLEAMACGLPVIGTRVPGIRELIEDEVDGLLCDLNMESLRMAIRRVMDDGGLARRLGENARRTIVETFSLEKIVELEMALLNELSA